jgi:predicted RNase H-like HicB family nuclease
VTQPNSSAADDDRGQLSSIIIETLRAHLSSQRPSSAVVTADNGGWSAYLTELPFFTAHGDNHDEVINDLIDALREYAEDWNNHLHDAPNHKNHWSVVALIELSTDEQLKTWLLASASLGT